MSAQSRTFRLGICVVCKRKKLRIDDACDRVRVLTLFCGAILERFTDQHDARDSVV